MARNGRSYPNRAIIGRLTVPVQVDALAFQNFRAILGYWTNRMKAMAYPVTTRVFRSRFIPGEVQSVTVPLTIYKVKPRPVFNPFTRSVRSHVLALGPAAYVPVKGKTLRHFLPSTPHIVRRVLPYQCFVPVPGPRKAIVQPPYVRVRSRVYPIQPNSIPIMWHVPRQQMSYYASRQRVVPVQVIGPPIFLNRIRQQSASVIHRKEQVAIPFNTPSAPFPVHAVRQFARPSYYRRSVRFIPGDRQDIVVPFIRKRNVSINTHSVSRHVSVIPGPVVTVTAPFFLARRPQQVQTYYPIRMRSGIIATQAVVVVQRRKMVPAVIWPRKARTPFYVNVNVPFPTPYPLVRYLPRVHTTYYPRRVPVAAVALPPPNVQNIIVASKRTVR